MRKVWWWILVLGALALVLSLFLADRGPAIQEGSALVIELDGAYADGPVNPFVARLLGRRERSLLALLSDLAKAERDDRIAAVVFRIRSLDVGWGKAEEIRAAIERLSRRGRRTIAQLEFEKLGGNLEYYVASAADEIAIAPGARQPLVGLAAEFLFLGGLFEKIGVDVEYERIGEYKSAVESYAESKMSDANREMTTALLDSIDERFVSAIATARDKTEDEIRAAIDLGPSHPERLVELGLVDRVAFFDETLSAEGEPPVVEAGAWARVDPESIGFAPQAHFAVVFGAGPVVTGEGRLARGGRTVLAADTVAEALERAAKDPQIAAIILRVDSPGGSPLASDVVWRAVRKARESRKPLVASLSDVAASGGYYVACGADRIVSQPTTYTGSIGVFVLRPALGGLLERLGVGVETMTRGARAEVLLTSRPLSPTARAVLREDVESVYDLFVARVAEGRGLEPASVDGVGRGRVWTGAQAQGVGLVDALGGLRTAVDEAKQALGLDPGADVALLPYPPPKPLAAQITEALGLAVHIAAPTLPIPAALRAVLDAVSELPTGVPLLIPPALAEIR